MLQAWLPLLAIVALIATWHHVLRLRERATAHARRVCEQHGLQLLDESVALHRLQFGWRRGVLHVTREYQFYTSLNGDDRRGARIAVLGDRIVSVSLPEREPVVLAIATPPRAPRDPPSPDGAPAAGDNVIPIGRARRTLH